MSTQARPTRALWLITSIGVVVMLTLAGCGSSHEETVDQVQQQVEAEEAVAAESVEPAASEEAAPATQTEAETEVGGPLSYVGTITGAGDGTVVSGRFSVGPVLYASEGTPPEALLSACYTDAPVVLDSSVFVRGSVAVTYERGTLPILPNGFADLVTGEDTELSETSNGATYGYLVDGEWQCGMQVITELQPGETQTYPFWVLFSGVLSNTQPHLPADVPNSWRFRFLGQTVTPHRTIRGPGKGWCEENYGMERQLFLYNRSGQC
jgi:hypothetical protein